MTPALSEALRELGNQIAKVGSDLDEINTDLLDPDTAELINSITSRMHHKLLPAYQNVYKCIDARRHPLMNIRKFIGTVIYLTGLGLTWYGLEQDQSLTVTIAVALVVVGYVVTQYTPQR